MALRSFVQNNFHHFNARELRQAAEAYDDHIQADGKMFVSLAGAMSTARLGITLAKMIRAGKIHAICCTGANLEEDIYNLVAGHSYKQLPKYRDLTPADEKQLFDDNHARITDVAINVDVMIDIETKMQSVWQKACKRYFPHEFMFQMIKENQLHHQDSWVVAAYEMNIPLFVPGWEDSTLGNAFAASVIKGKIPRDYMKSGIDYMISLVDWYKSQTNVGFFQIGGGIAGDFSICVVPLIRDDLQQECESWQYFCQISDSTTSYGSYSGAVPNEKITWNKIDVDTPTFLIESDATIVAPLIFGYVLDE